MKNIIIVCLLSLWSATSATAEMMTIVSSKVNVRESADTAAPIVKTLKKGQQISVEDNSEQIIGNDIWVKLSGKNEFMRIAADGVPLADYIKELPSILMADKIIKDVMKIGDKPVRKDSKPNILTTESNLEFIEGEGLHRVQIALKDINRISCPGKISDPIYSKDKQIEIVRGGDKDLFVKISPVQTTYNNETNVVFNDFPREVFFECSGNVYNLSLIPKELTSRTIVVKTPIEDIFKAKNFEQASDYEELVTNLIKHAYIEQAPDGYNVTRGNLKYTFKEMDMRLRYTYRGHAYIVEDWEITSKLPDTVELEENLFVPVLKTPRAITLITPRVSNGEKTRLIVVRLALDENIK